MSQIGELISNITIKEIKMCEFKAKIYILWLFVNSLNNLHTNP